VGFRERKLRENADTGFRLRTPKETTGRKRENIHSTLSIFWYSCWSGTGSQSRETGKSGEAPASSGSIVESASVSLSFSSSLSCTFADPQKCVGDVITPLRLASLLLSTTVGLQGDYIVISLLTVFVSLKSSAPLLL